MNRTHIGLIGAAVLGALTACSGGPIDDPETATTSQNLIADDMVSSLKLRASCVITDNGVDKMFVAGGANGSGVPSVASEVYDPTTDTWTAAANLPTATAGLKMVKVPGDDKCLAVGGFTTGPVTSSDVYLYDLSDNAWTQKADIGIANGAGTAQPRQNGALSVCGTDTGANAKFIYIAGDDAGTVKPDIFVYDLNGDDWSNPRDLATARTRIGFASNDNDFDQFIVTGGLAAGPSVRSDVELFQVTAAGCASMTAPVIAQASSTPLNITARFDHVTFRETVAGGAGQFVVALGENSTADDLSSALKITVTDFATTASGNNASLTNLSSLTTARSQALAVPMIDGRIALVGGVDLDGPAVENAVQFYKPTTDTFSAELDLVTPRTEFVGELLSSEFISIVGSGSALGSTVLDESESL